MLNHELEELIDLIGGPGYVERALNVHRTTLLRWRSGATKPSQATMDVLRALAGRRLPGAGKEWEGWSFCKGKLIPPDFVWEFTVGDIRASYWDRQRIKNLQAEVTRLQDMVQELAKQAKSLDPAANDMAVWATDPRALQPQPEPAVAPRPGLHPPEPQVTQKRVSLGRR
jgi:hypothetical protein